MTYDYFEERFIEENYQEEIMGKNTSKVHFLEFQLMKKQWNKDHIWVIEQLKKLDIKILNNKYGKPSDINSFNEVLRPFSKGNYI